MAIGAGFQDVQLQLQISEVQNRQTRYRQLDQWQQAMYQRRMRREDEVYAQKQAVDQQERLREQMGAAVVGSVAQGGTKKEQYERILTIIKNKQYDGIDVTSTSAGRMFLPGLFARDSAQQYSLDHYKSLGLTPGQSQKALERKHLGTAGTPIAGAMTPGEELEAKYRKAKTTAVNADDPESVEFWDRKLTQAKGTAPLAEAELRGGMPDRISSDKATKYRGYDPHNVQTVVPTTEAKGRTTEQYGDELMGMYGDILHGPGDRQPTPEELRAENTREAYEKGKKLGYWK